MSDRRSFLGLCASAGFSAVVAESLWKSLAAAEATPPPTPPETAGGRPQEQSAGPITLEMLAGAEALAGYRSTDAERRLMLRTINNNLAAYEALRMVHPANSVAPAMRFSPTLPGRSHSGSRRRQPLPSPPAIQRPASNSEIAFLSVMELAGLIASRQLTSLELTQIYLDRLKRYDGELKVVVNLTEQRALKQAAAADKEIAAGKYRGPLHGIPYGVKDTLSVPGYPTTWGAAMYRDRVLNTTATVIERLDAAGAVLIAKLAMGELGLNDRWYGGLTVNPWKEGVGARGSSSGSAAGTAAGLVGFAIGADTTGSIVIPASRCGVTAIRPTFGRVSRHGSMVLCWSLDKIGPMARSVEDCAVILEAIAGPDGKDPTVANVPYAWDPARPVSDLRIGYFKAAFEAESAVHERDLVALEQLRRLGVEPIEIELPTDLPINSMLIVRVEAAASLEQVARSGQLNTLAEQHDGAWPTFIRAGRLVPAVDYLQAMRLRTQLMERMEQIFQKVDLFMTPAFGTIPLTALTGHPAIVVPNGFATDGLPASISFVGKLYGESELCTVARAWQNAAGWHKQHPSAFSDM